MHPTRTSTGREPEADDPSPKPSSCLQRATRSPLARPWAGRRPQQNKVYGEPPGAHEAI